MSQPIDGNALAEFVREGIDNGWPSAAESLSTWMSTEIHRSTYSRGPWTFVDIWSGASTDAGLHVVFYSGTAVWSCLYRGGLLEVHDLDDTSLERNPIFTFLIEALKCERHQPLPLRGPARLRSGHLSYEFECRGTLLSFVAIETITDQTSVRYERLFIGGLVGDGVTYGRSLRDVL